MWLRNHSRRNVQAERVTGEGVGESIEDGAALLAPSGTDRADPAEGVRPRIATERARHLLLDLDHAQIAFRLVVIEGHGDVVEEGEDLLLPQPQAFEQVLRGRLFDASTLARAAD
jgi:hypothetical protein